MPKQFSPKKCQGNCVPRHDVWVPGKLLNQDSVHESQSFPLCPQFWTCEGSVWKSENNRNHDIVVICRQRHSSVRLLYKENVRNIAVSLDNQVEGYCIYKLEYNVTCDWNCFISKAGKQSLITHFYDFVEILAHVMLHVFLCCYNLSTVLGRSTSICMKWCILFLTTLFSLYILYEIIFLFLKRALVNVIKWIR